jgi:hypothetical protein
LSISSNKNNGLITSACFIPLIIFPGSEPTYVLLCPRISDSSFVPPKETLTNFLLIALAIEIANDVFPTPGGPTRQIMGDLPFGALARTAKNSIILSLTFSNP